MIDSKECTANTITTERKMSASIVTPGIGETLESGLRQRKSIPDQPEDPPKIQSDGKDKEEVTWGKTASGQGKLR